MKDKKGFMKKSIFLFLCIFCVLECLSLDLNNASLDELLNGTNIDLIDAMKIMDYRKENRINDIDQLVKDNVISQKVAERFKNSIERKKRTPVQDMRVRDNFSNPRDMAGGSSEEPLFSENETFQKILEKMTGRDFAIAGKYIAYFRKNFKDSVYTDDVIYFTGAIYEEANQLEKAISNYNILYERFSGSDIRVIAVYRTAICYEKSGDISKAVENYRKIVQEFSDSVWAEKARQRIEEL